MTDPTSRSGGTRRDWAAPDTAPAPGPGRRGPYPYPAGGWAAGPPYAPRPGWDRAGRTPSGLFPTVDPGRPVYREEHPAGAGPIALGAGATAVWMALFGLLADNARGYVWWTIVAGLLGWLAAGLLVRFGDRGVAAGVALASGTGVAVAGILVAVRFAGGHWLLW